MVDCSIQLGFMGKYAAYRPSILNAHRLANLFAPSVQSAIVVQQKKIPDVSFYQEVINFELMRAQTDALIIRAGQNTWVDAQFRRNWIEAKKHGILRGAYWFYDDRIDPGRQAELFASLLQDDLPEMEIWCDWENSYGGSFGGLKNVVAFMQRVEQLLPGVEIGLYTGYYWFVEHSNVLTNASQYAYLKTKKLFLGWYTSNAANVLIPAPFTSLFLWQFGTPAVGKLYGVATAEIDMSFINMTEAEFQQKYSGATPPPGDPMTVQQGTVKSIVTKSLNVRDAVGNVVAALRYDFATQQGDQVYGEVGTDNRIYFSKIYRSNGLIQNLSGPCSAITKEGTTLYMDLADVPEPGDQTPSTEYFLHVKDGVSRKFVPAP